jgi:hypothetical protein
MVDTTAPTVSVTYPAANATVFGKVAIVANVKDTDGTVASVQFLVDGQTLATQVTRTSYSTYWDSTTAVNGPHTLSVIAQDIAGNQTTSAPVTVNVSNTGDPSLIGKWAAQITWPTVSVHMALLRTGKVISWSDGSSVVVWDPATGTFTSVPLSRTNIFCAGHSALADGTLVVIGGKGVGAGEVGNGDANRFDPQLLAWSMMPSMSYLRWYPDATTLPDGRVLATAGLGACDTCIATIPEVYDPTTNTWTQLTGANSNIPQYPFMFVLPDGRVLHSGGPELPTLAEALNVNTQAWTTIDQFMADGGSAAMYFPGKIIKSGSSSELCPICASDPSTYVLDMNQASPFWRQTMPMAVPRAYHNLTVLPDGSVLVTGGELMTDGMDLTQAVYAAEMWSPVTEMWQTMASMQVPRLYHSTALLLPDGRVLESGGGFNGAATNELNAEIYSPPYLFKGSRPTISSAPGNVHYGTSFVVATPDAPNIASVSLIRPGAVTHSFNQDEGFLRLGFQQVSGGLNVQAPANSNLAPPGYYMLFIVNTQGVPSVAPFVRVN